MTTETVEAGSWARSTVWLVAANVLRNLGLLAVLLALGQLTTPAVVGRYAFALALTAPIFVFAQLGLKGVYLTLRSHYRFTSFLLVQVGAIVLATAISIVVAAVINSALVVTVALVCLVKAVDGGFELGSGALQRFGRTAVVFWSYLVAAILGIVAVVGTLLLTRDLNLALAGLGLTNGIVAVVSALRLGVHLARRFERGLDHPGRRMEVIGVLRAGVPTGAAQALLSLVASLPQYFLAATHGEEAVGYFAVLLYLVAIADIFGGTLTQAWIPSARHRLESGHSGFLQFTFVAAGRWTLVFIPLVVLGILLAGVVLPIAMSPDYRIGFDLAVPLAVSIVLLPLLHFGGTAMQVLNMYAHGITLSVAAAATCVIASAVLVPSFGIAGALWATVFAYFGRSIAALVILVTQASRGRRRATAQPPQEPPRTA